MEFFAIFIFIIVAAGLDILLDRADADMPAMKLPKEVVDLIEYNAAQAGCKRSCTIGLSGIKVTVPWQGRYHSYCSPIFIFFLLSGSRLTK